MFGFFKSRKKKIFVLMGQEDSETTCGKLADAYQKAATSNGHEVRRVNLGDLKFDPFLHKGYKVIQALEPDLKKVQEDIKWADHVVIIYPTWWSSMPAILKGFFDRTWLPGFAFHFHPHMGWDALLKGKSGRVIITMDSWPMVSRLLFGDSTNEIARAILWFSGIRPVRITKVGPLQHATEEYIKEWEEKIFNLGLKAK